MGIEKFEIGHFNLTSKQLEELERLQRKLQGKEKLLPSEKEELQKLVEKEKKMKEASGRVAGEEGKKARESLQKTLDQF